MTSFACIVNSLKSYCLFASSEVKPLPIIIMQNGPIFLKLKRLLIWIYRLGARLKSKIVTEF